MSRATRMHAPHHWLRLLVIAVPLLWLAVFFLLPFLSVLKISFALAQIGQPPYTPLFAPDTDGATQLQLHADSYALLADDALYLNAYLNSLKVAGIATLLCLLIGYPMAYAIANAPSAWRSTLLLLVILPFWTSFLLRVYAWIGILKDNGILNHALLALGVIDHPLPLLHSPFAVYLGIVYSYLPFMVLPLYANLVRRDPALLEAAADLGCPPWRAFLRITLPLSLPGIVAGSLLVFIPAVGEFVIPDLLGGAQTLMIGKVIWSEFFTNRDWPTASALTVLMLLFLVIPLMVLQRVLTKRERNGVVS